MLTKELEKAKELKDPGGLKQEVIAKLKTIYDPEIPINIYDLGLIYEIRVEPKGQVYVKMTLTTPNCPVAEMFPISVENRISQVPGVSSVVVEIAWDPPWTPERMTPEGAAIFELL